MQLEQIFYLIGTIYFGLWLIITLVFLIFAIIFMLKIRSAIKTIEDKLTPAKNVLNFAQSGLVRKVMLFVGSLTFVAKTVSALMAGDEEKSA
jgi:hypothetical protein